MLFQTENQIEGERRKMGVRWRSSKEEVNVDKEWRGVVRHCQQVVFRQKEEKDSTCEQEMRLLTVC